MDSFALSVITEPIAVNMISLCERDFLEAEKALWGRTLAIWNTVTITAGMIILGIYGISARFRIYLIPSGIVCVLTIGLLVFCICYSIFPQWIGGLRYRKFKSNNGHLREIAFFSDHFELRINALNSEDCLYADIKRIVISENLYIIVLPKWILLPIRHTVFSEEQWRIIHQRITAAKIQFRE